ncbi:MAG TPA: hypothetical protein VFV73_18785 [Streptosporangiaceae bacterium]|nr:hypothetical protein [Streptosporangiaceae bacterium]
MTETAEWHVIGHPGTGLELPVPPGWQVLRGAGAPLVLAWPLGPGPGVGSEASASPRFRPNAVATVEQPPASMGLSAYTAASIANMQRMLTGLNVIAIDVIVIAGHDGRRVLCGHRDGAFALATEYWWTIVDGVATTLTASCQVEDYLDLSPVFENIAAGMVPAARVPEPEPVVGP